VTLRLARFGKAIACGGLVCFLALGQVLLDYEPSHAESPKARLAELARAEQSIVDAMGQGNISALWLARRAVMAASLESDFSERKPSESELPCLVLHNLLGDVAGNAISALAADTMTGAEGNEARQGLREEVDSALRLYLAQRQECAKGESAAAASILSAPVGTRLRSEPVTITAAISESDRKARLVASMDHLLEAERALIDAIAGKPLAPPDPAYGKGIAALASFGRAQAEAGDMAGFMPCRRLGGALFQMFDMAASASDMRSAQRKKFEDIRWGDIVASFDEVRKEAASRKRACAEALQLKADAGMLLVPERLLTQIKAP
jgi:hypothetical protein